MNITEDQYAGRSLPEAHSLTQPESAESLHKPAPAFSSIHVSDHYQHGASRAIDVGDTAASSFDISSQSPIRPLAHRTSSLRERSSSPSTPQSNIRDHEATKRSTIIQSFAPRLSVYASSDTQDLIADKGLEGGLAQLLKPFGEKVTGKVIVRDSHGINRAFEDYGLRITDHTQIEKVSRELHPDGSQYKTEQPESSHPGFDALIDLLLNRDAAVRDSETPSAAFEGYLHALLSCNDIVRHESFCHPVACLVTVSSRSTNPIETLRQLYALTGRGNEHNPPWMGVEYLRYYVLVHDEDRDDISKSTSLFEQMKRHFGLHCHLLRLRSLQCVASDDDSIPIDQCQWLSSEERHAELQRKDLLVDTMHEGEPFIFESDATSIKAFIREMVTQSIVPFMENRVMAWNDQVASRRKGIGGRFISISKRWTGFGSTKANNTTSNLNNSNFNAQQGFYPSETPEAMMRSLGDYAMMLRDWKLAQSSYDLVRSDFSHDKAWSYHAAANEMFAIATLLFSQPFSRFRPEQVDQALDAAIYSYLTRGSHAFEAKRCLILASELLFQKESASVDQAANWAARLLELSILGPVEQALLTERIAEYYSSSALKSNAQPQCHRRRQAAFWNLMTSLCWTRTQRLDQATAQMRRTYEAYSHLQSDITGLPFQSMQTMWNGLCHEIEPPGSSLVIDVHPEESFQAHRRSRSTAAPSQGDKPDALLTNVDLGPDGFGDKPLSRP